MEWTTYQNPMGYSLQHPVGWAVRHPPGDGVVIASADGQAFAVIQPLAGTGASSGVEIIQRGLFPTANLFPNAQPAQATAAPNGAANGTLIYRPASGIPGRAQLAYVPHTQGVGVLYAVAAPHAQFAQLEPVLMRILQSLQQRKPPASAPQAAPAPAVPGSALPPVTYIKFTDPQAGSFRMDVPAGWHVRGGLNHPQPGDRRAWWEATSPENIYLLCDPSFPQSLCHFPGQPEGRLTQVASGGTFINLKPSPIGLADCYLREIATKRFNLSQPAQRRPRPDIVALMQNNLRRAGVQPASMQIASIESIFQVPAAGMNYVASMIATSLFNGQYAMNMWAFWDGVVHTLIAPPQLIGRGDEVRSRAIASFEFTPRMMELYHHDEAIIAANSQAANAAQWNWFGAQQAAHNAQNAFGDTIVNNYWQQQASNDRMLRGWEHNQAVNAQASQNFSDATLGQQRLADDSGGKEYQVAAGHNYYWRNPQTGEVIGTETSTPPDYTNTYTPLRKL